MYPRFCLVDTAIPDAVAQAQANPNVVEELLNTLEETIAVSRDSVEAWDGLLALPVGPQATVLANILYDEAETTLDRDTQRRLQVVTDRLAYFAAQRVPALTTQIDDGHRIGHFQMHAFEKALIAPDRWYGLIGLAGAHPQEGSISLASGALSVKAFYFHEPVGASVAHRVFIVDAQVPEPEFNNLRELAFPRLWFHPLVSFRRFDGGYIALLPAVVDHLSFLNDEFLPLASTCRWNVVTMVAQARVSFSDENGNTKANKAAMAERKVVVFGKEMYFTYHTKIEPRRNRIHFHAPIATVADGKIMIGIFADHLLL